MTQITTAAEMKSYTVRQVYHEIIAGYKLAMPTTINSYYVESAEIALAQAVEQSGLDDSLLEVSENEVISVRPAIIEVAITSEAINAFFVALADYAAARKGVRRQFRELAELVVDHKVIRVSMQAEHATCVALHDMPKYGIVAGETFHLFLSGYSDINGNSYAYIYNANGCGCPAYQHLHNCKHAPLANAVNVARYNARKGEADTLVLSPLPRVNMSKFAVTTPGYQPHEIACDCGADGWQQHYKRECEAYKAEQVRKELDKCSLSGNRGFSLLKPSGADAVVV